MKEVFSMWGKTKMVVLVALCAGLYAALLIPFKGFVLIPGVTEFRPASALPVVMGLLFGPAGAWGSAIGNLIGDFFGSLGVGSLFGFFGNFIFAYVPYKIWTNLGLVPKGDLEPCVTTHRKAAAYVVAALLGSMGCALTIAWGLELLGMVPYAALGTIIMLNNSIPSIVLGLPILMVLYPRVKKWDLLWTDVVDEADQPVPGAMSKIGAFFMIVSILCGWAGALLLALGAGQALLYGGFNAGGAVGSFGVVLASGLGTVGMVLSFFIQTTGNTSGR